MILATTYPEPSAFFCGMAGLCIQFFVIAGCLLGLVLSFLPKTIRASFLLATLTVCAAALATVLIGLSMLLDTKSVTSSNIGGCLLWALAPTAAAVALFAWSRRQKKRLHNNAATMREAA